MNSDMSLVLGLLLVLLAMPSAISAFSSARSMRGTVTLLAVGGAMIAWAVYSSPMGYKAEDVPDVVLRVIAGFIR